MLDGSNASASRRAIAALICVIVAVLAAGCGGGGAASAGGSDGILKVGSTYNIDSLNPFVAIDAQAYNAFAMEYPAAGAVRAGPETRRRLGQELDDTAPTGWCGRST